MEHENFRRTYTLRCGTMGGSGFEIGNLKSPTETTLHLSFSIEKSDEETANTAKIQIWNLSDSNLKILDTKDCVVELKAGYGGKDALLLVGNITRVVTSFAQADRLTEIEVVDGRVELRDTYLTVSFSGAVDCQEVYQSIANQMGLPILFGENLSHKILPNGFCFVGKARTALQKLANACHHAWTIQNQVIQITEGHQPISTKGHLLSSDTGLIRIPKRITIGSDTKNATAQIGWEVEYFLNGGIGINDVVQVKSQAVNGYFRVHKVTFDGDNMEGDWICTAQLLEIAG